MGRQVFGCDICQDVCPWNRKAPVAAREGMLTRREMINPALEWLAGMDTAEFRRWFKGSPLERTRKKRLHRNVAIAMGNSGGTRFVPQLEEWSVGEDEVLAESARWALGRIRRLEGSRKATAALC
jgi:epoxyqueuosine reductase